MMTIGSDEWKQMMIRESIARGPEIDFNTCLNEIHADQRAGRAYKYVYASLLAADEATILRLVERLKQDGYPHARYYFHAKWLCGVTYRIHWNEPPPSFQARITTAWKRFTDALSRKIAR